MSSAVIKILVPEETTNYIKNPSCRFDTTGWVAVGASNPVRVLDHAMFGLTSQKVVTNGLALREGTYYRVNDLAGISSPITVSAWATGQGTVHIRLIESGGKEWVSEKYTLYPDHWTLMEVTGFSTGSDDLRLYVETDVTIPRAYTFYVAAAQMEKKPYSTTFCDGYQPGCHWNPVECDSNSYRDANTRQGGRWLTLAGTCRSNDNIYATVVGGLGMPPLQHNTQSWSQSQGSYFQSTKVQDRTITLTFHIKNVQRGISHDNDISPLHRLRQQLIDVLKPDAGLDGEPFMLSYQAGERQMVIPVRYEAGLEGGWDIRNKWMDSFPLRLLADFPLWTEMNQYAQLMNFIQTDLVNHIAMKKDGLWQGMNYGVDKTVLGILNGPRGEIYIYGDFTVVNNNASAVSPLSAVSYVARWDGVKWNKIATLDGVVTDMAISPTGNLYVAGEFSNLVSPPLAISGIAKYDPIYGVWSILSTGLHCTGIGLPNYHLAVAPNGDVYVVGNFDQAGGITARYIARWDGSSWHSLGSRGGLNNPAYSITINSLGDKVVIGGSFTDEYGLSGNALLRVAEYNVDTNTFSAMGNGLDNEVERVAFSPSGILYAVGYFKHSGTTDVNYFAKYNGSIWEQLGNAPNTIAYLFVVSDVEIYISDMYFYSDAIRFWGMWNGSTIVPIDIDYTIVNPSSFGFGVFAKYGGVLFLGTADGDSDFLNHSAQNTVNNIGSAEVKPILYVVGPGHLHRVENCRTGKVIYFDLTVLDDEEVTIDFGKGKVESKIRGSLYSSIMDGSNFSDFSLLPGENKVNIFMTEDVGSQMALYYVPQHWSADATVKAEALS